MVQGVPFRRVCKELTCMTIVGMVLILAFFFAIDDIIGIESDYRNSTGAQEGCVMIF